MQITVSNPTPTFEPGTYEMVLVDFNQKLFDMFVGKNSFGNDDNGERFVWTWGDPDDDTLSIEQLTTCFITPRSRAFENLVALLGPEKVVPGLGLDSDVLIGRKALVTVGLNDKGYSVVKSITAPVTKRARPVAQPAVPASQDEGLPF